MDSSVKKSKVMIDYLMIIGRKLTSRRDGGGSRSRCGLRLEGGEPCDGLWGWAWARGSHNHVRVRSGGLCL